MTNHKKNIAGLMILLFHSNIVIAADNISRPDNVVNMLQVFLGLAAVLVLIFAIAWFINRFGRGTLLASSDMKVIGNLPLGARERVVVVEVGEQQIMLGVTQQAINTLHVFPTPVLGQSKSSDVGSEDLSNFKQKLQEILSKGISR